ncbi:MAG: DUF937 domain-containing protein [Propionibacteriaceae bacterium]
MSAIDDILGNIPMSQLASQLGVDEATAESATRQALPALLGGLQANAQDPAGAASLAGALEQHSPDLVEGGVDLDQVNTDDGQKIVSNIFGEQQNNVATTLGGNLGGQGGQSALIQKLLPILAPIVLSYLAKRLGGSGGAGGLLGSLLGGAAGGSGAGGGGLADVLGGLLGGGQAPANEQQAQPSKGSGNPVLDMLGGLLGGGRR